MTYIFKNDKELAQLVEQAKQENVYAIIIEDNQATFANRELVNETVDLWEMYECYNAPYRVIYL